MATASQKRAAEKRAAEEQAAEDAAALKTAEAAQTSEQTAIEGQADQDAGTGADVEQDVADGGATTEGAEEPNRAASLARFATGENPEPEPAVAEVEVVNTDGALDFGGDRVAVVVFDYFAAKVAGNYRRVERGTVIRGTDELVARGVRIGALKEIEEG